jgi:hypothetical protein
MWLIDGKPDYGSTTYNQLTAHRRPIRTALTRLYYRQA